jgi:hypothetical protein
MRCISAINPVPGQTGRERMDLHCVKAEGVRRGCGVRCHMGVIIENPKPWVCHEYGFDFYHKNKKYTLTSYSERVDQFHQGWRSVETVLSVFNKPVVVVPHFTPISTDNNMHEQAWDIFHKLRKLVIFS